MVFDDGYAAAAAADDGGGGNYCHYNYEGWNFNSGNYLFTTDTK